MPASGTGVTLALVPEVTRGITPASPQLTVFRTISRNINLKKDLLESQEVNGRRQRVDVRHGFNRVEAEFGIELCMTTYDLLLQYALGSSAWAAAAGGSPVTVNSTSQGQSGAAFNLTRSTGNYIDDGFREGDWVTTASFATAAHNGTFRVTSVTGTVLTIISEIGNIFGATSETGTVTFIGQKITVGTNLNTVTVERQFLDIDGAGNDLYQVFRGCAFNTLAVNITPESLVTATVGIIGISAELDKINDPLDATLFAAPTSSAGSPPFAGIDTNFYFDSFQANTTAFSFTLDNQHNLLPLLGRRTSQDVYTGTVKVTGTVSLLIFNNTHLGNFQDEGIYTQFHIKCQEVGTSNFLGITFFKVKTSTADIDPPQSGAVIQNLNFEALEEVFQGASTTYRQVMQIQRSA